MFIRYYVTLKVNYLKKVDKIMNQVRLDTQNTNAERPDLFECTTLPLHPKCSTLSEVDKQVINLEAQQHPVEAFNALSKELQKDVFPKLSEKVQKQILNHTNKGLTLNEKAEFFSLISGHACQEIFNLYHISNQKTLASSNPNLESLYRNNVLNKLQKTETTQRGFEEQISIFTKLSDDHQYEIVNQINLDILKRNILLNHIRVITSDQGIRKYLPSDNLPIHLLGKLTEERQNALLSDADHRELILHHSEAFKALKPNVQIALLKEQIEKDCDPSKYTKIPLTETRFFNFSLLTTTVEIYHSMSLDAKKRLVNLFNEGDIEITKLLINLQPMASGKLELLNSLPKEIKVKVLSQLGHADFNAICELEFDLTTTNLNDAQKAAKHSKAVAFYKEYFLDSSNEVRFHQLISYNRSLAATIFNADPVSIKNATYLSAFNAAQLSYSSNLTPDRNLELYRSFNTPSDQATFFKHIGGDYTKIEHQNIQLFEQLTKNEKDDLQISVQVKANCYQRINDNNGVIETLKNANATDAKSIFRDLKGRQADIYRGLDKETRIKLDLNLETLKLVTKDYSSSEKAEILKMLTEKAFVEYYSTLKELERIEVYKLLGEQHLKMLARLFKEDTLAYHTANGNSPFTIEGANDYINRIYLSQTGKSLSFLLKMSSTSPQLEAFNTNQVCSDEQRFAGNCATAELSSVDIACSESVETGYFTRYANLGQFEKGEPSHCDITLTEKQSGEKHSHAFDFPGDEERFNEFARYNLPTLLNGTEQTTYEDLALASLREAASSPGSALAATFSSTIEKFKNLGYGLFDPEHTIENYFGSKETVVVESDDLSPPRRSTQDLSTLVSENRQFRLECKEDVSELKGQSSSCTFAVQDLAGNIFQSLIQKKLANGQVEIRANNPYILQGWLNFAKKIGMPQTLVQGSLLIGEASVTSQGTSGSSSGILPDLKAGGYRAAEIAALNLAPAALGGYLAYLGGKRVQEAINHSKKTPGQKAAGATLGMAGVLAGIAIAYNRLSSLQLTQS